MTTDAENIKILSEKATLILDIIKKDIPDVKSALDSSNPLEMLIATLLSAQCTDERVNKTTPALFAKYKTARDYAQSDIEELEKLVSSINFFRNKSAAIQKCAATIDKDFNGNVPQTVTELTQLPGIGRKTANIVLGSAFGIPAIGVDTHVLRTTNRLGLSANKRPDKIEQDLSLIIDKTRWIEATNLLVLHGRHTCKAKKPKCDVCPVAQTGLCNFYQAENSN